MITSRHRRTLTLYLAAFAAIFLGLACKWPWQGFFINISSTFVGIFIAVAFVDRFIEQEKRETWSKFNTVANLSMARVANLSISIVRGALHIEEFPYELFISENGSQLALERSRFADWAGSTVLPNVHKLKETMDSGDRNSLSRNLANIITETDQIFACLGDKIRPELAEKLITLREVAYSAGAPLSILPSLIGCIDEQLRVEHQPHKKSTQELIRKRDFFIDLIAQDLVKLVSLACEILRMLDK